MPRTLFRLLLVSVALGALYALPAAPHVLADGPDFSNVSDILAGRRRLLPVDDLVLTVSQPGQPNIGYFLETNNGQIGTQIEFPLTNSNQSMSVGMGRMFDLPRDLFLSATSEGIYWSDATTDETVGVNNPTGAAHEGGAVMADLTGDGYSDFAFISAAGQVYITTAANVTDPEDYFLLSEPGMPVYPVPASNPASLAADDLDGNGTTELILAHTYGNGVAIDVFEPTVTGFQNQIQKITLSVVGGTYISTPNPPSLVKITSGAFSGATNPNTALLQHQLVVLYDLIDHGHIVKASSILPTVTSTNPLAFSLAINPNSAQLIDSGVAIDYIDLQSDFLNFYGQTEQLVTLVHEEGYNTYIALFTLDEQLDITQVFADQVSQSASIQSQIAIGNFDQDDEASNPIDLEIASLSLDVVLFGQNCGALGVQPTVYLYQVDASNNFSYNQYSSAQVGPCYSLDNDAALPTVTLTTGDAQGRSLLLGTPSVITAQHIQPQIIMGMPPMHVDWAVPVGIPSPTVFNLSAVPLGFFSSYQTSVTNQEQSSHEGTTSFTNSITETINQSVELGVPDVASVTIKSKNSATQMWQHNTSQTYNNFESISFDASTQTGFDDQLWYNSERQNIYVYPVIGQYGCPAAHPNCNPSEQAPLNVIFSGPDQINQTSISGSLVEWYQPVREPGNIFSYPWNLAQLTLIEPTLDLLTSDNPTQFFTDSSTRTEQANWEGQNSQAVSSGSVQNYSWSKSVSVSGDVDAEEFGIGGGTSFSFAYNGSKAISTLNSSTTTLGESTGIGVTKPGTFPNPGEYQYPMLPYIFGSAPVSGTIQSINLGQDVQVQTNNILRAEFTADPTDPNAGDWWQATYTQPDVALNHPNRWTVSAVTGGAANPSCLPIGPGTTTNNCAMFNPPNADLWLSEFHWMKGFFITPLAANGEGPQIATATAGDQVMLETRVYNYSLADMPPDSNIVVQFYGQPWDETTQQPAGNAFLIDEVGLAPLPGFNSQTNGGGTLPNWAIAQTAKLDTSSHGDQFLVFWVLVFMRATNGTLVGEMPDHGLTQIPPTLNSITDALPYLQGHSNNLGLYKSLFYIAPQNSQTVGERAAAPDRATLDPLELAAETVLLGDKVEVRTNLRTGRARDGFEVLFYLGNPDNKGKAFEVERIAHTRGGHLPVRVRTWYKPERCGNHNLFAKLYPGGAQVKTKLTVTIDPRKTLRQMLNRVIQLYGGDESSRALFEQEKRGDGMIAQLKAARKAFKQGDNGAAFVALNTFKMRVAGQNGKSIPADVANALLAQADLIFACVK